MSDRPTAPGRPTAIVTGGTSGIGRAVVEELRRTHEVIAVGRDRVRLDEVGALDHVTAVQLDLTDAAGFPAFADSVPELDVLVHNAAIVERLRVEDARAEDWQRAFATNVIAPAELSRVFLPHLRRAAGSVVVISSGAARRAVPNSTVYSASKHALQAVTDGLRQQVSADGIRVSTVAPGPTDTPLAHTGDRYGPADPDVVRSDPSTVASAVRFVIDAPRDSQIAELWVRPSVE
ncbi:SDR family oxidoreductase [Curtobacterium sp. VKM Ac-2861]|uniref:SDR family oxidoreductase n=1 Tax=Curtobacterium sp. VKM Ac-2861 TaxID=2739016 RepID=UPI001565046D|nr:SDR family oxidoreductase [Curtobacterium sp. VKM Ac-2861]